ncbi:unnamed protein product [Ambrosiozyma monospora]|uniref:Unnamed protein product n=1 Tax=Ambrosiozyma monospora TaxID=43982 RepID=A0ACB5T7D5_AMBMO|nr:unnamed protein product [Ambrosiozyma monospora]
MKTKTGFRTVFDSETRHAEVKVWSLLLVMIHPFQDLFFNTLQPFYPTSCSKTTSTKTLVGGILIMTQSQFANFFPESLVKTTI